MSNDAKARRTPRACRTWRQSLDATILAPGHSEEQLQELPAVLREHLNHCPDCREYSAALRSLAANLRRLSEAAVEPGPQLHARWTATVRTQAASRRPGFLHLAAWWLDILKLTFVGNLRPIAALAPIWLLVFAFRIAAPPAGSDPEGPGQSPVVIVRLLKAEQRQLQTLALGSSATDTKRRDPAQQPRSQLEVPTPARQAVRERDPDSLLASSTNGSPSSRIFA
jgi:hypothetical protein